MGYDNTVEKLQRGQKISDKDYLVADEDGWTIAHTLAATKKFPKDFPCWSVSDNHGNTIAHQAAYFKTLPEDFDQWSLVNDRGDTVAHVAARNGTLTGVMAKEKNLLSLCNNQGVTVHDEIRKYGSNRIEGLKDILRGVKHA